MKKIHALAIDDEFTCFDVMAGDLLSLGLTEIYDDFTIGRTGEWFFKPRSEKYFTEEAEKVHGISYFKATGFPERRKSCIDVLKWLAPLQDQFRLSTVYWGSWNFDLKWLEMTMLDCGLDTSFHKAFKGDKDQHINAMKLAKQKLKHMQMQLGPDKSPNEKLSYTLNNVAYHYGIEFNHHNAGSDSLTTAKIYCKLKLDIDTWTGMLL